MSITLGQGLTIGSGISFGSSAGGGGGGGSPSFTVTSSDFSSYSIDILNVGTGNITGFTLTYHAYNTLRSNWYSLLGPQNGIETVINNAFLAAEMPFNNAPTPNGSIWDVTWGPGSTHPTGVVRLGWGDSSTSLYMSPVDTSDTRYLASPIGSTDGPSLLGTFKLPATFTLHSPAIFDIDGWEIIGN